MQKKPAITLSQFIDDAKKRRPIPVNAAGIKVWEYPKGYNRVVRRTSIVIRNGVLKYRGEILTGTRVGVPWWSGSARRYALKNARPAVTRFVPGRTGTGLTDDIDELVNSMFSDHTVMLEQNYGLWYDRRVMIMSACGVRMVMYGRHFMNCLLHVAGRARPGMD